MIGRSFAAEDAHDQIRAAVIYLFEVLELQLEVNTQEVFDSWDTQGNCMQDIVFCVEQEALLPSIGANIAIHSTQCDDATMRFQVSQFCMSKDSWHDMLYKRYWLR